MLDRQLSSGRRLMGLFCQMVADFFFVSGFISPSLGLGVRLTGIFRFGDCQVNELGIGRPPSSAPADLLVLAHAL